MDVVDIGAAVALAKKTVLPAVGAADAGQVLTVGLDGVWTTGTVTGAVISISGTTLNISGGDNE